MARRHAEEEASRRLEKQDDADGKTAVAPGEAARSARSVAEEEEERPAPRRSAARSPPKAPARARAPTARRRGKLTVTKALSGDDERMRSVAAYRRHLQRVNAPGSSRPPAPAGPREVTIPETITVSELANRMARRAVDVIKVLMKNGMMAQINDVIDADTAELVAAEYGHTVKRVAESDVLEGLNGEADDAARTLESRAAGRHRHGPCRSRQDLAARCAAQDRCGGGRSRRHHPAYRRLSGAAEVAARRSPSSTRRATPPSPRCARAAPRSPISSILVVAADDGVMPQTVEAIAHAKAANVPMIVAVNKIDKGDANPTRVKTELLQHEIQVEDLGGETLAVEVSATKGTNLDKLEEAILLQAELLDLKANPDRSAEGAVIEAKLDKGRGPVATVLVQRGTLKVGDIVVAGSEWGRVRLLINDRGETIDQAGPSTPVEVLGLSAAPEAGDEIVVVESEARAREVTEYRARKRRESRQASVSRQTLDQLLKTRKDGEKRLLPLVLKADVQGSVEAIQGALAKLGTDEVGAQVLQAASAASPKAT